MQNRTRFNISSVIDSFSKVNNSILVNDGDKSMIGTAIPYLYNLYSDLITNPSSVSVSEFQKMVYSQPILAVGLTMLGNLVKNEMGKYQHKNPKYNEFINKMFDMMDRTFDNLVTDMLTALWAGFYIGEKKYISDGRYIYVKDVQPRPAQSIIFRVDSQGHLKDDGIIQYYFNNLWTGYGNLLAFNAVGPNGRQRPNPYAALGDFDYPWRTVWAQPIGTVIIPKDKCVHMAYKGLDGLDSPYGRSLLRPAYDSYLVRSELTRITRNAANFNSHPIPAVVVDPNQLNTSGGQDPLLNINQALSNLGNPGSGNAYMLFEGELNKSIWIEQLTAVANLDQLIGVNKYFDSQMLLCCLFQGDLMGLSDKGSYALGETQQDLVGRNVNAIVSMVKDCIIDQVVRPQLEVNFNESEDFGSFEMTDTVAEDIALNLDKLNSLRMEGIKLKPDAIMSMLDMDKDAIESINNPILDNSPEQGTNKGVNSNFTRTRGLN
jgi:hypothetical protein